jgi:hypothetical protein
MPAASLLPRVRDLGKETEKMLAAGSRHGRRCHRRAESSWQAMVSVKNFHRSARARPPPPDTPDESSAVTTSQVTPSIHDFAVSLGYLRLNPRQLEFDFGLWTRKLVRDLIRTRFGIDYSEQNVGRILKMLGFSPQRPVYQQCRLAYF